MERDIEERGDADHAADIDEHALARNLAHRRHEQPEQEEADRPQTHFMNGFGAWRGPQNRRSR
jgi:hypothetical protein